ncbi:plastocyanin [Pelomonas saccharophila]|uniref:Plastocyanin n=1 Tax=Roseateles saccharophilus TaxID=304 RepID=A0ABU1YFN8_ROSSA|nr:plastocyanin [Roseateles saccharophilus]MDR7267662.1 plastocyanin [Roseateles saccharophilus]
MRAFLGTLLLLAAAASQAADLTVTVLDRNGKPLADAVVLVDSAVQGPRPAMVMEATVVQEKLRFVPTVSVVGLGAKVSFSNLDTWDHHVILGLMGAGGVYVDPGQNTQFRLAGRVGTKPPASDSKVLSQPGAYLLGCHIHGSMRGHIYVADTPWAKLGGEDGKAVLQGLPEGPAKVRIWHPDQLVDGAPTDVKIAATGGAVTVTTQIAPARRKTKPAGDPYFGG